MISVRPAECGPCPLNEVATGFQPRPEGSCANGVAIWLEALGEREAQDSLPARPDAPAGAILERTLRACGFDRQQFSIHNTVRCHPPKNWLEHAPWEFEAINCCDRNFTQREIQQYQPKVILALGNVPLRHFTGFTGKKKTITSVRGYILDNIRTLGIPVIGSHHPASLARDKSNLMGVLRADMLRAVVLAKAGGKFTRPEHNFITFPPIEVAWRWLEDARQHPDLLIIYDIETIESIAGIDESELRATSDGMVERVQLREEYAETAEHLLPEDESAYVASVTTTRTMITQIQFSIREGEAIVLPFTGDYIEVARQIMALSNARGGTNNWTFDDPLLAEAQIRHPNSVVNHDFQWAWHVLQPDLPRGLQSYISFYLPEALPWKHISDADPGLYGGCDVSYLRTAGPVMLRQLQERGLANGYERHVRQLWPMLVRASERGVPINNQKRLELKAEVHAQRALLDIEIQDMVPDEIKNIEPKNGYVNPKIAEKYKQKPLEPGEKWVEREFGGVLRWARLQPFLPGSSQQILRWIKYMRAQDIQERVEGYRSQTRYAMLSEQALTDMAERNSLWKIPTEFKTGRETSEKKALDRLAKATKHILPPKIIEHREFGKMLSTYVEGWMPAEDGAVHTTWSYAPATPQLSSRAPNVQNGPIAKSTIGASQHRSRIADKFQEMQEARPGHKIVCADFKSFHVLTLGYEARSASYMRLARLDMHSFVTAYLLKIPGREQWLSLPDAELASVLSGIKKAHKPIRDGKAKPSILAIGFCAGANRIYDMNMESFSGVAEVKQVRRVIEGLFPDVFSYQKRIALQAHTKGFLTTEFGTMRYFWDVFHWDSKKGCNVQGKDYEAAVAYRPASIAFGMKKDAMLRLEEKGAMDRFGFNLDKHDALWFECPNNLVDECVWTIQNEMQQPCPLLKDPVLAPDGLWCEVEVKVGPNARDLEEVKVRVGAGEML